MDFESLETCIRSSMHGVGSILLKELVNADGGDYRGRTICCEQGHVYEFMGYREKEVRTVLGGISVKRAYYYDTGSMRGVCPKDTALDIEGTNDEEKNRGNNRKQNEAENQLGFEQRLLVASFLVQN